MTAPDSLLNFVHETLVVELANLGRCQRLANADVDRASHRKLRRSWPGVVRAVEADWQKCYFTTPCQRTKTGVKRQDRAVGGPCSFREDQNDLAPLEPTQRFSESRQTKAIPIDGYRVQELNQPSKRCETEERLSGQIIQPAIKRQTNQYGIEEALMVRADEHRSFAWHIVPPLAADAEQHHTSETTKRAKRSVSPALNERSFSHLAGREF